MTLIIRIRRLMMWHFTRECTRIELIESDDSILEIVVFIEEFSWSVVRCWNDFM